MAQKFKDLTDQITGATASFTVTPAVFSPGSTILVMNGAVQRPAVDYAEAADAVTLTLTFTPIVGDILGVYYEEASAAAVSPGPGDGTGMAGDTDAILTVWGQTLTIRRKAPTFSDSGKPTQNWASNGLVTGVIQPISGNESRQQLGEQIVTTHKIYVGNGEDVRPGDRVRPYGWVTGNDEYEVRILIEQTPSHVRFDAEKVRGHGG